ncbi:hypothetical protein CC85DRAFT_329134 [Cutaneotrichosporon oleaginosum]|uniref:Uncharacterized protein n=1 Tax=Cutaneotrichosporon oleaginosum TaxID=879819 RepID=A0A0J0XJZ2_9TREE|nr:uncharacterized protein CC85DRAFT_329134 [Cutaneotrichosporon oleaginosum]KLT41401.1 hypothetical protein CC85DRAFT_329134 [Cutaneotrichosporon oleaginosum]TXT06342.1 hypothetical protein COLE_05673 [Cutaneotrichosporon oleaginosum]
MPDWLYHTAATHTTEVDAAGHPISKDTWEARVLGQVVYRVTTQAEGDGEKATAKSGNEATKSSTETNGATKPTTLADKVAHETHWLDVDRTADSRADSPEPEVRRGRVTSVGVLGFNVWGKGEGKEESHWLDVDRIADSRADSPVGEHETKKLVGSPLARGS